MLQVILPALNEAAAMPHVLGSLPPTVTPLVVDNGSTDATADVARAYGAQVVSEPRRGFGAACFAGLQAATAEFVCFMDCDGSFDPADLLRVAGPVQTGSLDLCLGARNPERGAWPAHARLANRVLAAELRRRAGLRLSDIGPIRCARRAQLLGLGIADRGSGWPLEMVLRASAAGWRVGELPVAYRPRAGGRSKVSGSVRGTFVAVRDMRAVLRAA